MKIERALISVSNKSGLAPFAKKLADMGVQIISTGGTAKMLKQEGIPHVEISEFTGFPEMLDGRVKTLHPAVHGGLLYLREDASHCKQIEQHGIKPIDLVCVNLYPFEQTIAREGVTLEEAIEQIDIGGPSMLRSAAKNYRSVTVVTDPCDYPRVIEDMEENDGATSFKLREHLAIKVFVTTSRYDAAISNFLDKTQQTGESLSLALPLEMGLRYGENPHQQASLYGSFGDHFEKLHGKELSFNNIIDINAAADLIDEFTEPTVAILKHTNPCGVGSDSDLKAAWEKAYATDKQSPFGGIIITNRPLTLSLARAISEIFSEVIIAPDFDSDARAFLQKKKNLRLMRKLTSSVDLCAQRDIRSVRGGILVQDKDLEHLGTFEDKVVTQRPPTKDEMEAMYFGWRVVKHVKSNAIVYCAKDRTLGIGAGQMSRVDSSKIAVWKAKEAGLSLTGSIIASDAFFPFADGLVAAAEAGATAAIQPGGSVRDAEVIEAADKRKIAMVCTGVRHFKH